VRDLMARRAAPQEIARRAARGNTRMAERLVEAANRYHPHELEAMLRGLFEADLAIKTNAMQPEPAVTAWLGEHLLGTRRAAAGRG
jgi:DNA polymerase III delta subunit